MFMMITRRNFVSRCVLGITLVATWAGGLLKPLLAFAEWQVAAFNAEVEEVALEALFPGFTRPTPSDAITIGVYDLVENGAVVPVKIETVLPNVVSITIVVAANPNPLIANFNMSPECSGSVSTRIKMAESSMISVIVQSDGNFFSAKKKVEVVQGGCG